MIRLEALVAQRPAELPPGFPTPRVLRRWLRSRSTALRTFAGGGGRPGEARGEEARRLWREAQGLYLGLLCAGRDRIWLLRATAPYLPAIREHIGDDAAFCADLRHVPSDAEAQTAWRDLLALAAEFPAETAVAAPRAAPRPADPFAALDQVVQRMEAAVVAGKPFAMGLEPAEAQILQSLVSGADGVFYAVPSGTHCNLVALGMAVKEAKVTAGARERGYLGRLEQALSAQARFASR